MPRRKKGKVSGSGLDQMYFKVSGLPVLGWLILIMGNGLASLV